MAFDAHANLAVSTVATAPSPATSGTSLVVAAGQGSRFPTPPFNATICPANTLPDPSNSEIVRVTNISTDTLTITRAQESTSARTVLVGDVIFASITAKTLTDIEGAIPSSVTEDMNGVWGIVDQNIGVTTITNTSKPASPDWTYTVQAGDIPSDSRVTDWLFIVTIGGKNNDTVTQTANIHFTHNGTEIGGSDASRSVTTSLRYWSLSGLRFGLALSVGDVIGAKIWASASGVVDYQYATIYIIPKTYALPVSTDKLCTTTPIDVDISNSIHGAATGVTYAFSDTLSASTVRGKYLGFSTAWSGVGVLTPSAVYLQNLTADNNTLLAGLASTPQLLGIQQYRRYFHRLT